MDADVKKLRKWRLIVRNVNFQCSEDDIRSAFSQFGEIAEIQMPKKKGRFAGFCFVQFVSRDQARDAMKGINGQQIKDRIIAVDWAVPKDEYMTAVIEEKRQTKAAALSSKNKSSRDVGDQEMEEAGKAGSEDEEPNSSSCSSDEEDQEEEIGPSQKRPKRESDVGQGCTLFIRGVPFDIDNEELAEKFEKFGELRYALICKYKDTDQSKGTGFVQFVDKNVAENCLEQGNSESGIVIKGRRLCVCLALSKDQAEKMTTNKNKQEPVDKRNLHLLRVGLIRAGTKEANDMSDVDAEKRQRIEASNRQKIKNLNIFVSPTRLCVHNLPTQLTDNELKTICRKATSDKMAFIKECRVMRDLNRKNSEGVAKSRGYAFVEFDKHENALECLKNLNNNPTIFTDKKRPIVEFSLENRLALNAKLARLERSKANLHKKTQQENTTVPSINESKKRKLFVPPTVPRSPGCPKNPFPSHMGPKIRTRNKKMANQKKSRDDVKKSKNENTGRKNKRTKKSK